MSTFNGIGTMYYGHADPLPDGTYTATEWFVIFWVPIFPIGSYRLLCMDEKPAIFPPGIKTSYASAPVPLNKKQVIKTYAISVMVIVVIAALFLL